MNSSNNDNSRIEACFKLIELEYTKPLPEIYPYINDHGVEINKRDVDAVLMQAFNELSDSCVAMAAISYAVYNTQEQGVTALLKLYKQLIKTNTKFVKRKEMKVASQQRQHGLVGFEEYLTVSDDRYEVPIEARADGNAYLTKLAELTESAKRNKKKKMVGRIKKNNEYGDLGRPSEELLITFKTLFDDDN